MKKIILQLPVKARFKNFLLATLAIIGFTTNIANAQVLATFPLRTANAVNNNTPAGQAQVSLTNPNVVTGTLASGVNIVNTYNATGFRIKTTGVSWTGVPKDGYYFDIPFKPATGYDMNINGIKLDITYADFDITGSKFTIAPYYQVNGVGPWQPLGTAQQTGTTGYTGTLNFGPVNENFYSGNNYVVRFYVSSNDFSATGKNDELRIMNLVFNGNVIQPIATPPVATTLTATISPIKPSTEATVTGSYDNGATFIGILESGILWSTSNTGIDTNLTTRIKVGSAGNISATLSGLTPNTQYYAVAYIVTKTNTISYGVVKPFKTDPPKAPTVTTDPATNILSNKAIGNGTIVDDGGSTVTARGFVWSTSPNPSLSSSGKLTLNSASAFSDFMKGLLPGTTYYYKAYATNAYGTTYGLDQQFTTAAAVPVLTAIPGTLDFGENFVGANAITVSYNLTGASLSPASGNITISIPANAGFKISLSSSSGFGTSITLPYSGGKVNKTPIFVQFPTTTYGTFNGVITHSGGGVAVVDADVVNVKGTIVQSPDDISNNGTDFWLGFGYEEKMSRKAGDADECRLSLYVSNPGTQPATVHVNLTSGGYTQTQTIPGGGSYTFTGFPTGDPANNINAGNFPDSRLYSTGISKKSIHVYTDNNVPVAVFMHSYTHGNSAAGAMIFPSNTWNSSYTVQAFGGTSNNSNPNSFFFVIANEDNTVVKFTPTKAIIDASATSLFTQTITTPANTAYNAGTTYTITLNKGEVFNALGGFSPAGNGMDLSGSTVSTTCDKKITVFGGNGRCFVNGLNCSKTTGSDHMIQQMFPSVAWGTKYLTAPTTGAALNYFRIYFQDPATVVKVNGVALTAASLISVNGTPIYYQYQSAQPALITSDKPINVSQFQLTPDCTTEGNDGGPEMIILSPVEQAISSVVFFSPTSGKNIIDGTGNYTSYMNVIIPTSKVSSFKLDGVAPAASNFKVHPQDATYSYASLLVTSKTKHSLTADTGFVAIAYGFGDGESYGFNAGTAVKNLSSYKISVNPQGGDSSSTVIRTCVNTPITLKIAFPYLPSQVDKIVWEPNDPRVSPNVAKDGAIAAGKAVYDGTVTINNRTFYVYTSPVQYTFAENSLYRFKATAFGNFQSDCAGEDQQTILVNVGQDNLNLHADPKCNDPKVQFSADTIPMVGTHILSWKWDFGDTKTATDSIALKYHTFPPGNVTAYKVKLTTLNSIGCYSTDSLDVDFGGGLKADFTISDDAVCANDKVTFTDASFGSGTSGSPNSWKWDFGDTKTYDGIAPPDQSYTTPGIKTISLTVTTPIGCVNTKKDTVTVEAIPVAKFTAAVACLGDSVIFSDKSTISVGTLDARVWDFGDGSAIVTDYTTRIAHKYAAPGKYGVKLITKSLGSCTSTTYLDSVTVLALPVNKLLSTVDCTNKKVTFTDNSTPTAGTIVERHWDFGDGTRDDGNNATVTHNYPSGVPYTATLWVRTSNGCQDSANKATVTFTISASPVSSFSLPGNICLPNAKATFANTSTITDGTESQFTSAWDFGDGKVDTTLGLASAVHYYSGTGPYTVKLTTISVKGCTNNATPQVVNTIFAQPKADFSIQTEACVNAKAAFSGTGTAAGSTGDQWFWDFTGTGTSFGTSSKKDTVNAWSTDGTKTVKHYFVSKVGCVSDTSTKTLIINALPKNGFDKIIDCSIKKVTFTDTSSTSVGNIIKRHWDFGDGLRDDGNNATVPHTYTTSGPFTATLWVESSKGCQDSSNKAKITFTISATPASSFNLPAGNLCLPNAVATFANTSTIADATEAGFVNSWDFGDGTKKDTSYGLAPMPHTFTGVGPYTIKLVTTSVNGCMNTATPKILNTLYAQPKADFTAPTEACLNSNASFGSTSTAAGSSVTDWYWDLGNGSFGTASKKDTVANWSLDGNKIIRHYAVSAVGCISDTMSKTVTVNKLPTASFTQVAVACATKEIEFADASNANTPGASIVEWNWNFGDGTPAVKLTTAGPVKHTYALGGTFTATLTVKDSKGCFSLPTPLSVDVYPNPVPKFTVTDICLPNTNAQFTDASTITSGSVVDWKWDFGDATSPLGTGSSITHTYATGNVYKVILTVESDKGCSTTGAPVDVIAYNAPTAADSIVNINNLCSSSPVTLINQSIVNGYGTVSKIEIYWNGLTDPSNKTVDNAPVLGGTYTHKYPDESTDKNYDVVIRAFTNAGCYKDSVRTLSLLASPKLDFSPLTNICEEKDTLQLITPIDLNNLPIRTAFFSGDGIIAGTNKFFPALAQAGNHIITYTDTATNGCVSQASQPIFVYPTPTIKMDQSKAVLVGSSVTLKPTVTGNIQTYEWSPGTYLDRTDVINPISTPVNTITYTLKVTTKDGCETDSTVKVIALRDFPVPNTFTPNNDGINDFWIIQELPFFPIQRVQVFNRYGQVVYETHKYDPKGWDGNYKGKALPIGTYYYIIELNGMLDPKVGYVTIIK